MSKTIIPKQTKVQGMFSPGDGTLGDLDFPPFTAVCSFFFYYIFNQLHALLLHFKKRWSKKKCAVTKCLFSKFWNNLKSKLGEDNFSMNVWKRIQNASIGRLLFLKLFSQRWEVAEILQTVHLLTGRTFIQSRDDV